MNEIRFLTVEEVTLFHHSEVHKTKEPENILDHGKLEGAVATPQSSFDGEHLYKNIFEMAGAYVVSIACDHPFENGNKRVAAVSASMFLMLNGYALIEYFDGDFAQVILDFLEKKIEREGIVEYLKNNSFAIES